MDGFDPLDPNNFLSNTLPIHTSNDDFNNFLPPLGPLQANNNYNLDYGRCVMYLVDLGVQLTFHQYAGHGHARSHNGT